MLITDRILNLDKVEFMVSNTQTIFSIDFKFF